MANEVADIIVDFESVVADEYTTVKPGEYDVTIKKATMRKSNADDGKTHYPYISFEARIDEGQNHSGAPLFFNAFLAPVDKNGKPDNAPIKRTKFVLLSLGIDVSSKEFKFNLGPEGQILEPNFVGIPAHAWVAAGKDQNGRPRAEVYRMLGTHAVSKDGHANSAKKEGARYA